MRLEAEERHSNPMGTIHGGIICDLADAAMGMAFFSTLEPGESFTTLELKVNYIRAMTDRTGPVRAEGKTISVGNQTAVAEGRLTDSAGKLLAFATTTCLVFAI